jgi:hypothetical protein
MRCARLLATFLRKSHRAGPLAASCSPARECRRAPGSSLLVETRRAARLPPSAAALCARSAATSVPVARRAPASRVLASRTPPPPPPPLAPFSLEEMQVRFWMDVYTSMRIGGWLGHFGAGRWSLGLGGLLCSACGWMNGWCHPVWRTEESQLSSVSTVFGCGRVQNRK